MKTAQPRKQRKMLYQAPLHIRHGHFSAPLTPSLKASRQVSSLPVRAGDTVRIMRGDRKGSEGKISKIDRKKYRIFVEGITREKVDGTAVLVPIHPSKVIITNLNMDDKWRSESLKVRVPKEVEKKVKEEKKPKKLKRTRKKRRPRKAATNQGGTPGARRVRASKVKGKGEAEVG